MRERLILATDLDGTLAHGPPAAREQLLATLRELADARLVYVTGRTPDSARALLRAAALPAPDVLIADVGTSVLRGLGPERVAEVEAELSASWPGAAAVRERLAPLDSLREQAEVNAPRRVSYWVEPVRALRAAAAPAAADPFLARGPADPSFGEAAAAAAQRAGRDAAAALAPLSVDVLVSGNVFLDVLPRGVHKGSTLERVLQWLGAEADDCVVAGDSLNDLALFETGLRGIAVGNCEPALLERLGARGGVYRASAEGAAGILEGLRHYGYGRGAAPGGGADHGE